MLDPFMYDDWALFKSITITRKNLSLQYVDKGEEVLIVGPDQNNINLAFKMRKKLPSGAANPDYADFIENVEPSCNWAIGNRQYAFATPDFLFGGNGVSFTVNANSEASADLKITQAGDQGLYINGGDLYTNGAKVGDYVKMQVVDVDGIMSPAGTIISEWITKWYADPKGGQSVLTPYAGKIPGGLYLRITYKNTNALTQVNVAVNYHLHKPLES